MGLIVIENADDPRIADYRDIRERDLTGRRGLFVAEGAVVLRVLASAASRCRVRSVLLADNRVAGLADVIDALAPDVSVHVAPQAVLDGIVGFPLHRGILALGEKPATGDGEALLAGLPARALVLAASGIGNHDNMGGLFRNAAAFGADAVAMDEGCCDPFYRKAVRVSAGTVLRTPLWREASAEALVERLHDHGFEVLALTPSAAEPLREVVPAARTAVLMGAEGPGLPPSIIARCRPVGIPMAGGVDSLNVAVAAAVALHHLAGR